MNDLKLIWAKRQLAKNKGTINAAQAAVEE